MRASEREVLKVKRGRVHSRGDGGSEAEVWIDCYIGKGYVCVLYTLSHPQRRSAPTPPRPILRTFSLLLTPSLPSKGPAALLMHVPLVLESLCTPRHGPAQRTKPARGSKHLPPRRVGACAAASAVGALAGW